MADEPEYEVWREIWEITERRDGAVFKTKFLHCAWVPMGSHGDGADLIYASPNKPALEELAEKHPGSPGIRRKKL